MSSKSSGFVTVNLAVATVTTQTNIFPFGKDWIEAYLQSWVSSLRICILM